MAIKFLCACGKKLTTQDRHADRKTKCPACGRDLVIPNDAVREADASYNQIASGMGRSEEMTSDEEGRQRPSAVSVPPQVASNEQPQGQLTIMKTKLASQRGSALKNPVVIASATILTLTLFAYIMYVLVSGRTSRQFITRVASLKATADATLAQKDLTRAAQQYEELLAFAGDHNPNDETTTNALISARQERDRLCRLLEPGLERKDPADGGIESKEVANPSTPREGQPQGSSRQLAFTMDAVQRVMGQGPDVQDGMEGGRRTILYTGRFKATDQSGGICIAFPAGTPEGTLAGVAFISSDIFVPAERDQLLGVVNKRSSGTHRIGRFSVTRGSSSSPSGWLSLTFHPIDVLEQAPNPVNEPPFVVKEFEKTIGWVRSVKISRDGRRFATVSKVSSGGPEFSTHVTIWDAETGEEIKKETGIVESRYILLDDLLTSVNSESQLVVREIESGRTNRLGRELARDHSFWCSAQSQDGRLLAIYLTEVPFRFRAITQIIVIDLDHKKLIRDFARKDDPSVTTMAFDPKNAILAVADEDGYVTFFDISSGQKNQRIYLSNLIQS
jgi:hypothetical protein